MNRNVESHFAKLPHAEISRSRFDRSHSVKFTGNIGQVIPFCLEEVLPGDTFSVDTAKVVRLQTPLTPIMDNIYMDTYWFFIPNRLVWEHWKEFCGENTNSPWIDPVQYTIPQITAPSGGWNVGTIADYLGIPTGVDNISVNALPFRAVALVMNEWFRDENLTDPLVIPVNDTTVVGSNGSNYITDTALGGAPFLASKYHDYFTSALPDPQKGPDVTIQGAIGDLPVVGNGKNLGLVNADGESYALSTQGTEAGTANIGLLKGHKWAYGQAPGVTGQYNQGTMIGDSTSVGVGVPTQTQLGSNLENSGLIALSSGTAVTINQLREAFQMQKFYEKMARQGSRYTEILSGMFGVTSPDSRLQRPEYLGGNRLPVNINQVVQTSATQAQSGLTTTPQGTVTAYSLTTDNHSDFTHSFVEHGFLIGFCVMRYDHTYQQGIDPMFSRKNKFDYYWPVFANIGEQPILNKEIYAQGSTVLNPNTQVPYDEEVFGYQEAWAHYRYKPNRVCGEMRSTYARSLDVWHLGDDYSSLPTLSDSWIREDKSNVDRVLAVQSSLQNQFFADFFIRNNATRPMPLYSIPGLIDHH